jgi:hypothetical protein
MNRSIRPTTPADASAMGALFAEVGLLPNLDPEHLRWKYWQPRTDWPGPRSFVLASASELLAHGAVIPGIYAWGSRCVSTIQMIDWVARRGEAGAGVTVMKYIAQQAESLLSIGGGAETLRILPHVGFRPVGAATAYVRTLFPSRLLRSEGIPRWRRWPRVVRSAAWTLTAPSSRRTNWEVRRLVGEDVNRIASVLPVPTRGMAVLERSVDLFRYITSCPDVPMALYAVESSGITRGYFLLASQPGQVRIADCWMNSDDPADWRALIFCAVDEAKRDSEAAEVVSWASDPLLARTLQSCGFHARYEIPIQVRVAAATSMPASPLRVQMLDNDAVFLHQGRNGFWA